MTNAENPQLPDAAMFFDACARGDVAGLRAVLAKDPSLVHRHAAGAPGWTGLHAAAKSGHAEAVRLLLAHGADPNAREAGDNTYALHWAAAHGHFETVRALIDAGGDVHGAGDVHNGDTIGWASRPGNETVVQLLLERGARHHIFSAMALGDQTLVRALVGRDPHALARRRSRFENEQTPLHAAFAPPDGLAASDPDYAMLALLLELGADVEAEDGKGRTPLAVAMLRGDREAMRLLKAAGAREPQVPAVPDFRMSMANLSDAVKKGVPMIKVPDIAATLDWYESIGFTVIGRYEADGVVNFGMLSFGKAELMLTMNGTRGDHDVVLWFYTDRVDELYGLLKARQMEVARAVIANPPAEHQGIEFVEDIYDAFYGAREFGIRDLNGYVLYFIQPTER